MQIAAHAKPSHERCAVCHDTEGELEECASCGVKVHLECRIGLKKCPTLGCGAGRRLHDNPEWSPYYNSDGVPLPGVFTAPAPVIPSIHTSTARVNTMQEQDERGRPTVMLTSLGHAVVRALDDIEFRKSWGLLWPIAHAVKVVGRVCVFSAKTLLRGVIALHRAMSAPRG